MISRVHIVFSGCTCPYMMPGKRTSKEDIKCIVLLHKEGKSSCQIAGILGLKDRTTQDIIKNFVDSGGSELPKHGLSSGRPKKHSLRTIRLIKNETEANTRITAKKFKAEHSSGLDVQFFNRMGPLPTLPV